MTTVKGFARWLRVTVFCVFLGMNLVAGCATMKRSMITGTAVGTAAGATTGAAVGSATKVKDRGGVVLQSALIGGLLGLISSWFVHRKLEIRDAEVRRETLFNLEKFGVDYPKNPPDEEEWTFSEEKGGE